MAGTPFKLCLDSVSTPDKKVKIGIVAKSFDHLKAVAQEKLGLSDNVSVFLEDGTLICEEEYFNMLEPQTKLTIRDNWQNGTHAYIIYVICVLQPDRGGRNIFYLQDSSSSGPNLQLAS